MQLEELLRSTPAVKPVPHARHQIHDQLESSTVTMVVLDDDPTGTQTVHSVPVLMSWTVDRLKAVMQSERVIYLSTNSRSLTPEKAAEQGEQIGRNLKQAGEETGRAILPVSRSDSTLRGHYPVELDALLRGMDLQPDAVLLVPAFFEGGRYTVDDVHYVDQGDRVVPAHETEFARDTHFGYKHSNLKDWVEEKTAGRIRRDDVRSVSLDMLRVGGVEAVAEELLQMEHGVPVVVNAACYDDLDIFSLAMIQAEAAGKRFVMRSAASIVKSRGGVEDRPLLNAEQLGTEGGAGLVVVGSYVDKTTRQLKRLLEHTGVAGVEVDVHELLQAQPEAVVGRTAAAVDAILEGGKTAVVFTSRETALTQRDDFLALGERIMEGLCAVVRNMAAPPAFVVAKGGITSYEVARAGLGMQDACVLGQIIKGVPVWEMGAGSKWKDIPYVVYPGNVGDDGALHRVVSLLQQS